MSRCILFFFSFKRDSLAEVAGNWDLCHQQILGTCEVVSDLRNSFEFVVACVFSCKNPYALHEVPRIPGSLTLPDLEAAGSRIEVRQRI